ncbi:hypothetical protein [Sphingomonas sp. BAUL-RG-20F-R05-02]|uniref:hypothetical protein n=1 Tax=Sphingomonas sp. BAUL-RG-20F-R05-02 TaxID=2914830 RepID=UPI001F59BEA9|nr:hypothetical protein [Sphingomonas sp. BAUL-RG-20F-R05-02]
MALKDPERGRDIARQIVDALDQRGGVALEEDGSVFKLSLLLATVPADQRVLSFAGLTDKFVSLMPSIAPADSSLRNWAMNWSRMPPTPQPGCGIWKYSD